MGNYLENRDCGGIGCGRSAGCNSLHGVARKLALIVVHCTATR